MLFCVQQSYGLCKEAVIEPGCPALKAAESMVGMGGVSHDEGVFLHCPGWEAVKSR